MNDIKQTETLQTELRDLMASQNLAVLATHDHGQPYTSLVAFAGSDDLKTLVFFTGCATRKFANLKADPRAAMMIDSRSNAPSDIAEAMAVTAAGTVGIAAGNEPDANKPDSLKQTYLQKHPHLADFANSPSTRLIQLTVSCYYVVDRFQHVVELHI